MMQTPVIKLQFTERELMKLFQATNSTYHAHLVRCHRWLGQQGSLHGSLKLDRKLLVR
jgi:hypothetical protein